MLSLAPLYPQNDTVTAVQTSTGFSSTRFYFFLMRNYRLSLLPGFGTREMKRELVATLTKAIDKILWSDMCAMCLDPFRICVILRIIVAALVEYASGKLAI